MSFYIYENRRIQKGGVLIIHRGECGYCSDGEGCHGIPPGKYGRWHGPQPTLKDALTQAGQLRPQSQIRLCSICLPKP